MVLTKPTEQAAPIDQYANLTLAFHDLKITGYGLLGCVRGRDQETQTNACDESEKS